LESLNDYLFALSSHAVYWDSKDCLLFMLNQVFDNADCVCVEGVTTPTNTNASLTPRGETNYDLLTATDSETSVMKHSTSNPAFSSNPISGSAFHPAQHFYPPSRTSMLDPSPPPSMTSLHSQSGVATDLIDLSSTSNRQTTVDSNFVEIDLAP
uniref:DDHD domain-containing protein n=1 Tax=Rodentolepis nana TaxID=102285 RepID=A0A0R3T8X2_RODNA